VNVGERIRRARKAAGLSQEEVARRAGLSLKGMGAIERGWIHNPHLNSIVDIAAAIGVPVTALLEEEELVTTGKGEAPLTPGQQDASAKLLKLSVDDKERFFTVLKGIGPNWTPDKDDDAKTIVEAKSVLREMGVDVEDARMVVQKLPPFRFQRKDQEEKEERQYQDEEIFWLDAETIRRGAVERENTDPTEAVT